MKVSVIVPVYNAAGRIEVCLKSLCAQTLQELEIVIVDDCGHDNSMELAHRYASAHPERKFTFAGGGRNLGPGGARNLGISLATGEYVAFVDSDDTVSADFCDSLYNAAVRADADLACCSISFDFEDGHSEVRRNPSVRDGNFGTAEKRHFLNRYRSYFTTFVYRTAMLRKRGIVFPGTHSAEDSCFLACSLLSAGRIAQVDSPMYHYHIGGSSVSRKKDPGRWKNRMASFREVRRFANENGLHRGLRVTLAWLRFRKGTLLAVRDFLTNI